MYVIKQIIIFNIHNTIHSYALPNKFIVPYTYIQFKHKRIGLI